MIKVGTTTITEIKKTDLNTSDKHLYIVTQSDAESSVGTDLLYADLNNNNGNSTWYTTGEYSDKQYFQTSLSKYGAVYSGSNLADVGSIMFRLKISNANWDAGEEDRLGFYPAGYNVRLGTYGGEFAILKVKKHTENLQKCISIMLDGGSATTLITYQVNDNDFQDDTVILYVYVSILTNPKPTTNIPEFSFCICSSLKKRTTPLSWSLIYPTTNHQTLVTSSIIGDTLRNEYGVRMQYTSGIQNTYFALSTLFNSRDSSYYPESGFTLQYGVRGVTESIPMKHINPYDGDAVQIPDLNDFNI